MENRNKDRDSLERNRNRVGAQDSSSSPGSQSDRGSMDRSTRGGQSGSQSGSQSSNVGSTSGTSDSRSRDDESEIGSPGRDRESGR